MKSANVWVLMALTLSGCGNPYREVVKPTDITLDNALSQVVTGIAHVKELEKTSGTQLGSIIDQVDIDFQLAVTGNQQDKLSIAVTAPTGAPVSGSLGASDDSARSANRGSTIHLVLKSVVTAPLNYVGSYYLLRTEYSESAAKGCTSIKATDAAANKSPDAPKKDPKKDPNKDKATAAIPDETLTRSVLAVGRELVRRDAGFVVTDAAIR